jgi:hypothetical protein
MARADAMQNRIDALIRWNGVPKAEGIKEKVSAPMETPPDSSGASPVELPGARVTTRPSVSRAAAAPVLGGLHPLLWPSRWVD